MAKKRPDLTNLITLGNESQTWEPELSFQLFNGIPFANETVWFHAPSKTLILTDLCQWWQGDLAKRTALYNRCMGVRHTLDVPRSVRALVRDRAAAQASAQSVLAWPFERIIMAHNTIIENDARAMLTRAFARFL